MFDSTAFLRASLRPTVATRPARCGPSGARVRSGMVPNSSDGLRLTLINFYVRFPKNNKQVVYLGNHMLFRLTLPLLVLAFSFGAKATTLTFNELTPGTQICTSYEADGYLLTGRPSGIGPGKFYVPDSKSPTWTGSPGIVFQAVSGLVTLQSSTGTLFDITSIDIARGDNYGSLIPVGFTGIREDGSKVFSTYQFTDSVSGLNHTFSFGESFRKLKSISWYEGAEWQQYDNIVVSVSSAVPEPGSMSLMGLAMAGLAFTRRRKTK